MIELSVYPEAFINNKSDISISNSNKAILCRNVLEKYKDILCDNKNGCIFKISYINNIMQNYFSCYVSCIEFTAPDNTIFISNSNFEKMCLNLEDNKINLEIFNPPQASKIIFTIKDRVIDNIEDIKNNLENLLNKSYKFLEKNQEIPFLDDIIKVKEIEPYDICLINNTDLNVEFDIIIEIPKPIVSNNSKQLIDDILGDKEQIVNNISNEELSPEITPKKLSKEELRQKRLAYYSKLR